MSNLRPTPEQEEIRYLFGDEETMAVEAGAGTGKTSTLVMLAEDADDERGQYVAFNKSIVTEAGSKMPSTVRCNTAHSLAFRAVGHQYKHRLNAPRMRSDVIARNLGITEDIGITVLNETKVLRPGYLASHIMRGIRNFCQSDAAEPSADFLPYIEGIDERQDDGRRGWINNWTLKKQLQEPMLDAWEDIQDPQGMLKFEHDHYLKIWAMNNPKIAADYILFDEAQDANPVLLQAISQQDCQVVWVGDTQQQIYAWRGAVNALASVPTENRAFLTKSFRFGQEIADVANILLEELAADLRLVGNPDINSVVGPLPQAKATLTRTNATAVRSTIEAQTQGKTTHLIGGGGEMAAFARGAEALKLGKKTTHYDLACFDTWDEVVSYANKDPQGDDLKLNVSLVEEFGTDVILSAINNGVPEANAEFVVSTTHKAKGREWASVQLGRDFTDVEDDAEVQSIPPEELRLMYVGVTRARAALDISLCDPVSRMVEWAR